MPWTRSPAEVDQTAIAAVGTVELLSRPSIIDQFRSSIDEAGRQ
jgi:hypothetical protein